MTHRIWEDEEAASYERQLAQVFRLRSQLDLGDSEQYAEVADFHQARALYFTPTMGTA